MSDEWKRDATLLQVDSSFFHSSLLPFITRTGLHMPSNPLASLGSLGQSPWYDFITRELLTSGELARLIAEDGLRGMTTNPTIFEKAIAGSEMYDEDIRRLSAEGKGPAEIFEALALEDVRAACDAFPAGVSRPGRSGRAGLARGFATAGTRRRGDYRRGRAAVAADRATQCDDQDSRYGRGSCGNQPLPGAGNQRQRDSALFRGTLSRSGRRVHDRAGAPQCAGASGDRHCLGGEFLRESAGRQGRRGLADHHAESRYRAEVCLSCKIERNRGHCQRLCRLRRIRGALRRPAVAPAFRARRVSAAATVGLDQHQRPESSGCVLRGGPGGSEHRQYSPPPPSPPIETMGCPRSGSRAA